ncbi:MAG TPA: hypothetical protein VKZ59_00265 [Acidobacteriota bacterium]|nr:hypothetical protein [Acidobacteriota bacterium]
MSTWKVLWFALLLVYLSLSGLLAQGGSPTLTVNIMPLDFFEEYEPACISVTENGDLIAFQSPHRVGYGKSDIWLSRFENGKWSPPVNAGPGINTAASEYDGKLSADGSMMVFIRSDDGVKPTIFISHWRDGAWGPAEPIGDHISGPDTTEYGAVFSRDGQRIYFSSDRAGGHGGFDVYYVEKTTEGWSDPINIGPPVSTEDNEIDAAIGRNEDIIVLAFEREDSLAGGMDLYMSRKENGNWTPFENMGPRFNTPAKDACAWLGYDGKTLYVNTTWDGLLGGEEMKDSRWGRVVVFQYSEGF